MSFEVLCRLPTARAACCRIRIRPSFHNLCCRNSARSIHAAGLVLSGHNKWSTIKHKKAALDEVKQATYNKLSSRITLAVKLGGADPSSNPRLEQELAHAKSENMSKETISRAIARGEPKTLGNNVSFVTYEVMLPGGVALVIEAMTDNKARTAAKIKSIISSAGGSFSRILYQFERRGRLVVTHDRKTFDEIMEQAIDLGALDVLEGQDSNVYLDPEAVSSKARLFKDGGYEIHEADTVWAPLPDVLQEPDEASAFKLRRILKELEADEDVTEVYSTAIFAS